MGYSHTTFSTIGADIGHMTLAVEQKDLVNFVLDENNNPLINIHIFAVFLAAPCIPGGAIPPKWHQKGMCGVCAGYVRMGFNMPAQISYFSNLGILWFPAGPPCLKFEAPAS